MTAIPNEVAGRRPANTPSQRPAAVALATRKVINGHVVTRRKPGLTVAGVFALLLLAALMTGFLLSMLQQAS